MRVVFDVGAHLRLMPRFNEKDPDQCKGDFLSHGRNTTNLHPVSARCLFPYITNKPQACSVKTETIHQHAESQEVIEEKKVRLQPGPEEDEETVQQEIQPQDRKVSEQLHVSMLANVG